MLKNVTITLDEEVLRRVRVRAAERGLSVSKLISETVERELRPADAYRRAFADWRRLSDRGLDIDAAGRLSREDANERHR